MMENFAILVSEDNCKFLNRRTGRTPKRIRQGEETRKLLATPEGRKQLYEDRDVKTVLDIMELREKTGLDAKKN